MPKQAENHNTRVIYFTDKLKKRMELLLEYPCTLVEAPMGYGKTTAVREHLKDTDAHVLWQKVYDSSTAGFWLAFCRLFSELDVDRAYNLIQLGFPNDSVSLQEALALISDIELPEKTVLVIDDYHLLCQTEVSRFINFLVVNEIDNLHIVLTARFVELLSIEELSLKGLLCHITKETFEFLPYEIKRYYKLCGISIKYSDADKLYAYTEGWISALYLSMLNYKEGGSFLIATNIDKLIEKAVYEPFSEEIKDLLITICIFDSFTVRQAAYVWEKQNPALLIDKLVSKNAFINYNYNKKDYNIHSIFKSFLEKKLEDKDKSFKEKIYEKAAKWYIDKSEYLTAMSYLYLAGDFCTLLRVIELDKGHSFNSEYKDLIIKYFDECPKECKEKFPYAMLVYARRLFTFNEVELYKKVCGEFMTNMQNEDSIDAEYKNRLLGEFELLMSFVGYNDIEKMSEHHKKACELLIEPSSILDSTASWTFGSPSVLYMFYRETGKLEKEVKTIRQAMPFYYQITNGHGKGAELIMEAERYFYTGDFENAEIVVYKALQTSSMAKQSGIIICSVFLQIRLAFVKGDFSKILELFKKIREDINNERWYLFMHTLDMCEAYIYSCLNIKEHIPTWITNGEFKNTRLFFPSMAFLNIVYGRALLINGEYLKLIGSAEYFIGLASVFPNILGKIHTYILLGAANRKIFRSNEALDALKQALDIAMPDKVYMPFVENCDFIDPLLEELYIQGIYREDITRIRELYKPYKKVVEQITKEYFTETKPKLTEREIEVAQLAAEGLSNKGIGEKLFISQNTVKTQLKSVFEKLGVNSRSLLKQYFDEKS